MKRKPILTVANRRDSENHPEFLDTEALLIRFEPLIRSVHRRFLSYNGVFNNKGDSDDLYNQIVLEFLRLRKNYDPQRGVDFTGYIKLHLQQRIYHYVMKTQKVVHREQLEVDSAQEPNSNFDSTLVNVVDEEAGEEFEKVEALASIPWGRLTQEQSSLINAILIEKQSVEDFARGNNITIKSARRQVDELCEVLAEIYRSSEDDTQWEGEPYGA